jgi:hypothetical protein
MKPFAILFLLMSLSAPAFGQSQLPAQNDRGDRTAAVETMRTFQPVGPTGEQENSSWSAMGTDVRSTSLRTVGPTGEQENSSWSAMGTAYFGTCSPCDCTRCSWNSTGNGELDALKGDNVGNIIYTATYGGYLSSGPSSVPSNAECPNTAGSANSINQKGKNSPLSVTDSGNSCDSLLGKIYNYQGIQAWKKMYDTSKKFIESCYNSLDAPSVFQEFSGALQPLALADSSLWLESREWLESVLYLNTTNPEYFCACVEAIAATFHSPSDTSEELTWKEMNRGLP